MDQRNAPIYEALEKLGLERIVHFDVPGHKGGRGNKELTDFLGEKCLKADVNSMKPLDNLNHPVIGHKKCTAIGCGSFRRQ